MIDHESFLNASGQIQKFSWGLVLFVILAAALWMLFFYSEFTDTEIIATLVVTGAIFGLGAWMCFAIQCPACNTKLLWIAVHDHSIGEWLPWLMALTRCPKCGFEPHLEETTPRRP